MTEEYRVRSLDITTGGRYPNSWWWEGRAWFPTRGNVRPFLPGVNSISRYFFVAQPYYRFVVVYRNVSGVPPSSSMIYEHPRDKPVTLPRTGVLPSGWQLGFFFFYPKRLRTSSKWHVSYNVIIYFRFPHLNRVTQGKHVGKYGK